MPGAILLLGLLLLGCTSKGESDGPQRALYFESGSVCAEGRPLAEGTRWQAIEPGDTRLPPLSLLAQSGFLTCRAYQVGRLSAEDYRLALVDAGPTLLRSEATRALIVLGQEVPSRPAWVERSASLKAACLGLQEMEELPAEALEFCALYFLAMLERGNGTETGAMRGE